jgi:uncharacterized protein YprB with RNaseH-like and TPR domain
MSKTKKKPVVLRCVHRHTIDEHPKCFEHGLVKQPFVDDKEYSKVTGQPWYKFPGYRVGYFDIETDGLLADFGTVLSWYIKEKGSDTFEYDVITKKELFEGNQDVRLIKSFVDAMRRYNIIVGYNSDYFDLPYMRTKALHYGIDFPGYGEVLHWDLYYTAKSKLRLSRKSLDNVCDYLNIHGKTHIDKEVWRRAKYGDPTALAYVLEHNKGDVVILEQLHNKLEFTRKWTRKSI